MMVTTDPLVWIQVFLVLCILSYLYKSNIFFRLMQNLLIGATIGHAVVTSIKTIQSSAISKITEAGRFDIIIPVALGALLFARFIPKYNWLDRYGIAIMLANGASLAMSRMIHTDIINQVTASILSIYSNNVIDIINAIIIIIGTSSAVAYFIFTKEQKGIYGQYTRLGRIFILVAFGAVFGTTMVGRASYFVRTIGFLLRDWLGLIA